MCDITVHNRRKIAVEEVETATVVGIEVCDLIHANIDGFFALIRGDHIQLGLECLGVLLLSAEIVDFFVLVVDCIVVGSGVFKVSKT